LSSRRLPRSVAAELVAPTRHALRAEGRQEEAKAAERCAAIILRRFEAIYAAHPAAVRRWAKKKIDEPGSPG